MQAIDKKTGVMMDVWPSSRRDDAGKGVFVSLQGFRYQADELTFPERPVEPQRIYVVLHNAHEFDDLDYGESSPVLLSTDRNRARSFFDRLVEQARQQGQELQQRHGTDYYEEDTDNTDTQFCYYLGKWVYTYRFETYLMDAERVRETDTQF